MNEQRNIDDWCRRFRFTNRAKDQAHAMIEQYGVKLVTSIFERMDDEAPLGAETRQQQFHKVSEDAIREYNRQRSTRAFVERQEENLAESNKARQKGYKPTPETLRSQLDEMYDKGEISMPEYEWGIMGLQTVFGLVEAAQEEPIPVEAELTAAPF